MKRVVKFISPYTVWKGGATFYEALIDGKFVTVDAVPGSWKFLNDQFEAAREEHRKAVRARAKIRAITGVKA